MSERDRELQIGKSEFRGPQRVDLVPRELVVRPIPALTPGERCQLSTAAVGASPEVSSLLAIIERLTGEKIIPADEVRE